MSGTIRTFQFAPTWAPTAGFLRLMQNVTAAPAEGPWLPCALFKQMGITAEGTVSGLTGAVWFSNALTCPLNGYTVAIGGTMTVGDVASVTVTSSVAGTVTVSHKVVVGDTLNGVAAALAASLAASTVLAGAGFAVTEAFSMISVIYPSLLPGTQWDEASVGLLGGQPATAPPAQYVSVTTAVTGSATETATVTIMSATGADVLALTATNNHAALPTPARWVKAKITALNSGPCNVNLAGVA